MAAIEINDPTLTPFFQANPSFDILAADLNGRAALEKLEWKGVDHHAATRDLKAYQRLLRLYPDPKVAAALLGGQ
jgi:hypothetical protein